VVKGTVFAAGTESVLLAEEPVLERKVWLWLRPGEALPLAAARRAIERPTRQRWLGAGQDGDWQWDAFLAPPPGCSLPALVAAEGQLPWSEVRPLLEQLANELTAACRDNTLPPSLSVEQLWVQSDGRLLVFDALANGSPASPGVSISAGDQQRALGLLHEATMLLLEGTLSVPGGPPRRPHAPVPAHAARLLDRLAEVTGQYEDVASFQADLRASHSYPTQVTRRLRAMQVALQAGMLLAALLPMALVLGVAYVIAPEAAWTAYLPGPERTRLPTLTLLAVAWAFCFRGGWALRGSGLLLVRHDGRPASRLRCAWRALLLWAPAVFLTAAMGDSSSTAEQVALLLLMTAYVGLALLFPRRGPHDILAGTYLVPR
jgi:hypothetical protein